MMISRNSTVEKKNAFMLISLLLGMCTYCICMGVSILWTVSKLLIYNNMSWAAFIFYILYIWMRETTMKSWILNLTVNSRRSRRQCGQWPIAELLWVITNFRWFYFLSLSMVLKKKSVSNHPFPIIPWAAAVWFYAAHNVSNFPHTVKLVPFWGAGGVQPVACI